MIKQVNILREVRNVGVMFDRILGCHPAASLILMTLRTYILIKHMALNHLSHVAYSEAKETAIHTVVTDVGKFKNM